jgi:hypothetical protein
VFSNGFKRNVHEDKREPEDQSQTKFASFFDPSDKLKRLKCMEEYIKHRQLHPSLPLHEKNKDKLHIVFIEGVAATGQDLIIII